MTNSALITGGAGFVGTNLADRLASLGWNVIVYDNLSRPGVQQNAEWLDSKHGNRIRLVAADVRDSSKVRECVASVDQVFHLAAQVAVTSSLRKPIYDFEVNAIGTLNVLEALRSMDRRASLVFTSTNKVYGDLPQLKLRRANTRYESVDSDASFGVSESSPLDFHSPYGCSKGAADQYVLDYSRHFGIRAVVFRMSCIYGPHQMGTEDQGWVAHFLRQSLERRTITICGDGLQVRDILFVDDLVDAFLIAQEHIADLSGHAFNIGGGSGNTLSLVELLATIRKLQGAAPATRMENWRSGDQRYYVSDFRKFRSLTGWEPRVNAGEGIRRLYEWLSNPACSSRFEVEVGGGHAILAH